MFFKIGSIYKKQEKRQVLESLKVLETIQTVSAKRSSAMCTWPTFQPGT